MLEVVDDGLYQRHPEAILETFLLYQETVGIKGLSARTLRALYNARGLMDAGFQDATPSKPRHLHAHLEVTTRHHPRHALDEPNLGAGALFVGVQAHRWVKCSTTCSMSTPWTSTS